jgi:uncharacterized protein (TIGR02996 family)
MNAATFLAEICANPDDDTPRLVYADWLEDHGDPDRAELIRAQVELARAPAPRSRTRRRQLEQRVKALWKQHGKEWAAREGGQERLEHWERGFCATFRAKDVATLIAQLPARLTQAPIQHAGAWNVVRDDIPRLIDWPVLSRLRSLQLFAASLFGEEKRRLVGDADLAALVRSPHLTRLEGLDLTQHDIGTEGLRALTHAPTLPALRDLWLYGNRWDNEGLRIVTSSPLAPRLRKLHAGGFNITAEGARSLATASKLADLRVLNLDNTSIGDEGARYIARGKHFSGLTELWLHYCEINDLGVRALACSPHLANLERLDLSSNWNVGHSAAVALVSSPYLKKIRYLDLWRCERLSRADEMMLRKRFRSRVNFQRSY